MMMGMAETDKSHFCLPYGPTYALNIYYLATSMHTIKHSTNTVNRSFRTSDPNAIILGMLPDCSLKEKSTMLQWLLFGVSELRPFHNAECKRDRRKTEHVAGTLGGIERHLQVE